MSMLRCALALSLSVAVGAVLLASSPAQATVVQIPTLPEMTKRAELVVEARVLSVSVGRVGGRIMTTSTIEVLDSVKGSKVGQRLRILQLGGETPEHHAWIVGAHHFVVGEQMMLFGMRWAMHGEDAVIPFGVGYGVFDIEKNGAGDPMVHERIGDVVNVGRAPDGRLAMAPPPTPRTWALAAFKAELKGMVGSTP